MPIVVVSWSKAFFFSEKIEEDNSSIPSRLLSFILLAMAFFGGLFAVDLLLMFVLHFHHHAISWSASHSKSTMLDLVDFFIFTTLDFIQSIIN